MKLVTTTIAIGDFGSSVTEAVAAEPDVECPDRAGTMMPAELAIVA